jgi:hypothetical protein
MSLARRLAKGCRCRAVEVERNLREKIPSTVARPVGRAIDVTFMRRLLKCGDDRNAIAMKAATMMTTMTAQD